MEKGFPDPGAQVLRIYREIDGKVARLKKATGLACPPGCGSCCESRGLEATVVQVLPMAEQIYRQGREEEILDLIEARLAVDERLCIAFRCQEEPAAAGCCSRYAVRPLICRLFGFAGRRNKYGRLEFSTCKVLKETSPPAVQRIVMGLASGLDVPVYQEYHMRVAAVDPGLGFRTFPMNVAVKEAIELLHWRKPKKRPLRKVA